MAKRGRARASPPSPAAALPCRILQLPLPVLHAVLSLLPVDARLRCAEVCRAWREALADRALWTALDFSGCALLTDALLTAAASRAGGQLRTLTLCKDDALSHDTLFAVVTDNASTLRELRGVEHDDTGRWPLSFLLRAAPQLHILQADVSLAMPLMAVAMLSNQGCFAPLRLRRLTLRNYDTRYRCHWRSHDLAPTFLPALTSALRGHTSLEHIYLDMLGGDALAAVTDSLDALLANRLVSFELTSYCYSSGDGAAFVALVVRLLECETITHLGLYDLLDHTYDARITQLLAALQANNTLTSLSTSAHHRSTACKITPLLRALKSHPSLRRLEISYAACKSTIWSKRDREHASVLNELIAADAPALRELHFMNCSLDIKPALAALAHNNHLRSLRYEPMYTGDGVSDNDVRALLVPMLRSNTALRELQLEVDDDSMSRTMRAAVATVAQRGQ